MKRFFYSILLTALSISLIQCQREVDTGTPGTAITFPQPVTATVQGTILDETGRPASGVVIRVGLKTANTNTEGQFRLTGVMLDKVASVVTAEKQGYFKAMRTFSATSGANRVVIKLMRKTLAGTVSAVSGGEVTVNGGAKVNLKAGSVVDASTGAAYTGAVSVYAAAVDQTLADRAEQIPGSFMARNANNSFAMLSPIATVAVELTGSNGEKLQIKNGTTATLSATIPANQLSAAPANIDLWHLQEQTGLWTKEGTATRQGNLYVGEVSHFSYWAYSSQRPAVLLQLQLVNAAGNPVEAASISIRTESIADTAWSYGFTDSLGQAAGLVAANLPLVLQVKDQCWSNVLTQHIGPFSQSANLGVITLPSSANGLVTVQGTLLNCSGTPVSNGFVEVHLGGRRYIVSTNNNGGFAVTTLNCNNNGYLIWGTDLTAAQTANVSGVLTLPQTQVGAINMCGTQVAEYVNLTFDGNTTNYAQPQSALQLTRSQPQGATHYQHVVFAGLGGFGTTNYVYLHFITNSEAPGTYAVNRIIMPGYNNNTVIAPFNVSLTTYPMAVNGYMEGSFNGQFRDSVNVTHNLSGNFRLERRF